MPKNIPPDDDYRCGSDQTSFRLMDGMSCGFRKKSLHLLHYANAAGKVTYPIILYLHGCCTLRRQYCSVRCVLEDASEEGKIRQKGA